MDNIPKNVYPVAGRVVRYIRGTATGQQQQYNAFFSRCSYIYNMILL